MSEKTDREKVIKLATEVMGWYILDPELNPTGDIPKGATLCSWFGGDLSCWSGPISGARRGWNPLESISDAMDMQAKIPELLCWKYVTELLKLIEPDTWEYPSTNTYWNLANATARQRCDAVISALEAQR